MEKILQNFRDSEIIFGSSDSQVSRAINKALKEGLLIKLGSRLYTSNLKDTAKSIIKRNLYRILNELYPGAILSHRTALEGGLSKTDVIILTYKYTRKVFLHGITIRLIKGEGPQEGDTPFLENLFLASRERALLENFQTSRERGKGAKTISKEFVEEYLDKLCQVYGPEELNRIRDTARNLSKKLKFNKEFKILDQLIGALLGTYTAKILRTEVGQARASGIPYDTKRIELFANIVLDLKKTILPIRQSVELTGQTLTHFAFFEAYFSNYIEGTQFEIEEAEDIIFRGKLIPTRSEDSHDILGTFRIVSNSNEMLKVPSTPETLNELLKKRHAILMAGRSDKKPGKFKTEPNRAGKTLFVSPELVKGTLEKAFDLYLTLTPGVARAIFMMFLITEVHPFVDGNGRIARIMMNAELDFSKEARIIIPTIYRDDYLLSLRRLSRDWDSDAYIRMLLRAQDFTQSVNFSDYQKSLNQLKKCNAFLDPSEGQLKSIS